MVRLPIHLPIEIGEDSWQIVLKYGIKAIPYTLNHLILP